MIIIRIYVDELPVTQHECPFQDFCKYCCDRFEKDGVTKEKDADEKTWCNLLDADAAGDAGVSLRQIEHRTQSPDHPILWNVPETDYLKFYLFQVV